MAQTPRTPVADGSIVDHAFTPWKVVPTRCSTCGKVAKRHAVVEATIVATDSTENQPASPAAPNQPPTHAATPQAGNSTGTQRARTAANQQQAADRLAKTSASKAGGKRR